MRSFFLPFHLCSGVKAIALEVASSCIRVQCPVLHADPTELIPTLAATHVVASFVFLYCCSAAGTLLSVRRDPHSVRYILTGLREGRKEMGKEELVREGGNIERKLVVCEEKKKELMKCRKGRV